MSGRLSNSIAQYFHDLAPRKPRLQIIGWKKYTMGFKSGSGINLASSSKSLNHSSARRAHFFPPTVSETFLILLPLLNLLSASVLMRR